VADEARYPRLLVCEGPKDQLFFQHFIHVRGLPRFHIIAANGKDRFGQAIEAYQIRPRTNYPSIGNILIVADNDDDPADRFENVRRQIEDIYPGTAPDAPLKRSKKSPYCTVLMLPWTDEPGTLESLLREAARAPHKGDAAKVDHFLDSVNADKWKSPTRHGKAWLRSCLAVRCTDPFVPLGEVFRDHQDLILLKDKSLDRVAAVLSGLRPSKKS
jgi:hypothetical protein